jgi:aryl carrier-like protein
MVLRCAIAEVVEERPNDLKDGVEYIHLGLG